VDPLYAVLVPFALFKVALAIGILWWAMRTQPLDGDGSGDDPPGGGPDPAPRPVRPPPARRLAGRARPHASPARRPPRRERSAPVR
jgi:hypothetical protein